MTQNEALQKKNSFSKLYFQSNKNIHSVGLAKHNNEFVISVGLTIEDKSIPTNFENMRVMSHVADAPKAL